MTIRQESDVGAGNRALSDFVNGLTRASVVSAAVALATVAMSFVTYCFVFGEGFTASPLYRYQMSSTLDTHTNVSHKVLSRAGQPGANVIILGTSVTIRCVESEAALSDRIAAASGRRYRIDDLATDAQASWEMAAIVDRLPPADGGVLVIGLTPGVLGVNPVGDDRSALRGLMNWPRLGFVSTAMDDEARQMGIDVPWRTGIGALDNAGYILSRRKLFVRNLLRGGLVYGDPLKARWYDDVDDPDFWAKEIGRLPEVAADYNANAALNFDVIARMVERARQGRTVEVVVLEAPLNPGWLAVPEGARFFARFRADLDAFARRIGGHHLRIADRAPFMKADFVDYEGHLANAAARKRCSDALADGIAAMGKKGT